MLKKRLFLGMILIIAAFFPLYARDIEIFVEDIDLGIPLEGALLHTWDGRTYTFDEDGMVAISVPDDRQVVIQISYPGYETGRLVISLTESRFSFGLRMSGIMENQELVIEAQRPGTSETRIGRSVAISDRELSQTAEIGILEDVMTSVKMLPGVGYAGMFNALPSIRGGEPGDLTAVFDGFYVTMPYHWGGGVSIFDPRMVQSARLSHGVFSTRYGHTISGLLEVSSRRPSSTDVEAEIGVSSSAANLNLSFPLFGNGGVMFMGKATYWDPFIAIARNFVEEVQYIRVGPYIRSAAFSANYRFTADVEASMNGFIGGDGIGASFDNEYISNELTSVSDMSFDWDNSLGFLIGGVTFNPVSSMVLKGSAGVGFHRADIGGFIFNEVVYTEEFFNNMIVDGPDLNFTDSIVQDLKIDSSQTTTNIQGRIDLDWAFSRDFLLAFGVQELYTQYGNSMLVNAPIEIRVTPGLNQYLPHLPDIPSEVDYFQRIVNYELNVRNQTFETSAYALTEYTSPNNIFGAELGVRVDHLYFMGKDFSIQTYPAVNPRLNLDYNILRNRGPIDSLSATIGTGLFSSINDAIVLIEDRSGINDFEMKQNRSWTSVIGTKIDFLQKYTFNIEGYFKYVYDRAYIFMDFSPEGENLVNYRFDGEGIVGGFDFMLRRFESRFWDGWISYTFTHARYRNPSGNPNSSTGNRWFYPSFHRYHNLNMILNIKPIRQLNIATHLQLASGSPLVEVEQPEPYFVINEQGKVIQKWRRSSRYSDTNRTTWSIPLNIKVSWFFFNPQGRVQGEVYFALENITSLFYRPQANTSFNQYTGREETGSDAASYGIPIPLPSIGFKWSY